MTRAKDRAMNAFQLCLKRQNASVCSEWATQNRVMGMPFPGPWTFNHHPWSKALHDDQHPEINALKAAQMAFSETALNRSFHSIDIKRTSVLYLLPTRTDAVDFSVSRFDPALEASDTIKALFNSTKNAGLKRAGSVCLFVRGSRSKSQLKSIPVGNIIFDEFDEMDRSNVNLAMERTSGHTNKSIFRLSTPTISDTGIDRAHRSSDDKRYMFKCPCCSRTEELHFIDSLVICQDAGDDYGRSHYQCMSCKGVLPHETKREWLHYDVAEWVPMRENATSSGYYINQYYSNTVTPAEMAEIAVKAEADPTLEQEYHNSKGGRAHNVEGSRLDKKEIEACYGRHRMLPMDQQPSFLTVAGMDIGRRYNHLVIAHAFKGSRKTPYINTMFDLKVVTAMKIETLAECEELMKLFMINYLVIDAQPETKLVTGFARDHRGHSAVCYYSESNHNPIASRPVTPDVHLTVNRTLWMDMVQERIRKIRVTLPYNIGPEYVEQMQVPVRIYGKDRSGNAVGRYDNCEKADHYYHAMTYTEIALFLALNAQVSQTIGSR